MNWAHSERSIVLRLHFPTHKRLSASTLVSQWIEKIKEYGIICASRWTGAPEFG